MNTLTFGLENRQELITRRQRPRIRPVGHHQHPQRAQVQLPVVLGRQQPPVQVSRLANGHRGPVLGHHLHPGGGIDLHEGVGDEDDVHPVEDGGDDGVPEADLALEVEHADHDLALGVVARLGERARVREHRRARDRHAEHAAVSLGGVLEKEKIFEVAVS